MINLIPTALNESVTYARRNRTLVRWVVALIIGLAGIITVVAAGLFYTNYQVNAYHKQVEDSKQQLASQDLEATQKRVEEISSSVKLANQVLSQQVLFSKLLQAMGGVIPKGATLQNLNITNELDGGIDLQFLADDYQTGTQVQVNLSNPENKLFEKADIQSIGCSDPKDGDPDYPCTVQIRALFAKDSPFAYAYNQKTEAKNE
jgi:capsular polysaccharide biosynthesis protein